MFTTVAWQYRPLTHTETIFRSEQRVLHLKEKYEPVVLRRFFSLTSSALSPLLFKCFKQKKRAEQCGQFNVQRTFPSLVLAPTAGPQPGFESTPPPPAMAPVLPLSVFRFSSSRVSGLK